jgi:hypothetical protein
MDIYKGFGYPKTLKPQPKISERNYNARKNVKCFPHYTYKVNKNLDLLYLFYGGIPMLKLCCSI